MYFFLVLDNIFITYFFIDYFTLPYKKIKMSPICKCHFEPIVRQRFSDSGDTMGTKAPKIDLKTHKSSLN